MSVPLVKIKTRFCSVTPLCLHGADKNQAELRLPSIKGALRYWYRAACPDFSEKTDSGITKEELLFGGTRGKAGQSAFLMRLAKKEDIKIVRDQYNRKCFSGIKFELEFLLRPNLGNDIKPDWRGLLTSIWLLGHLGGLGSKSRKGYGTIALESWSAEESEEIQRLINDFSIAHEAKSSRELEEIQAIMDDFPIAHEAESFEEWEEKLRTGWENIVEEGYLSEKPEHTVLNNNSSLYIREEKKVKEAGEKREVKDTKDALGNGLALIKQFRSENQKEGMIFGAPLRMRGESIIPKDYNRLPSLIWLRAFQVGNQYYSAFLFLTAPFPELQTEIRKGKGKKNKVYKNYPVNQNDAVRLFKAKLKANNYRRICGHE
ncbi:type III-B CRISPR module RAMP protein Cmr1 [Thermoactinomyces mirandus]|uniref:Type III-B CRISPR module RAMP protein Cmr1 n=1 Tax=Thermoactinomyces mirandus TaxID=2756294 RepID=A0A7W2ASQ5_9BACL|nr:type III-B CRISPR module RAMP protein Cmr1 [Thermoactinomyces mirandus]MBA4603667.1 type III-B CRISPR module RAMP protein Cmr1 [Thermoactinomyces mirandus]